jgi:hypothetical protein
MTENQAAASQQPAYPQQVPPGSPQEQPAPQPAQPVPTDPGAPQGAERPYQAADAPDGSLPGSAPDPATPAPAEPEPAAPDEPTTVAPVTTAPVPDAPPQETGVVTAASAHPSVMVRFRDVLAHIENFLARHPELRGLEADLKSGLATIEQQGGPAAPGSAAPAVQPQEEDQEE